jgi:hypothetical protein
MKNQKLVTNFTALMQKGTQKKSVTRKKAAQQGALRGLMIQVVLLLCALSVANILQMQQWLQQN